MVYVGFWKRLVACGIDSFVIFALYLFACFDMGLTMGLVGFTEQGIDQLVETYGFVFNILFMLTLWLYFAFMESSSHQATIGKMVMGIKVVDFDWNPVSFWRATGRFFGKYVSAVIFYIGFLMVGFTKKKQGLHDIMAGTLVVNK